MTEKNTVIAQELEHLIEVEVKPEWIGAALAAVKRKKGRRDPTKREAIDIVRKTMVSLGADTKEPFNVTAAIVARFQAMNDIMREPSVADALTKAWSQAPIAVAVALSRVPLRVKRANEVWDWKYYIDPEEFSAALVAAAGERRCKAPQAT